MFTFGQMETSLLEILKTIDLMVINRKSIKKNNKFKNYFSKENYLKMESIIQHCQFSINSEAVSYMDEVM